MDITLNNIGKRYVHEWVFQNIKLEFKQGEHIAIIGPNGSGKSTLLQIISGYRLPSRGSIKYSTGGREVLGNDIFTYMSFASPYLELVEEFTMKEQLHFHFTWKDTGYSFEEIADLFNISTALDKPIKYFSSGMKQRLKLAMAFCAESEVLLLDEPTSNLDVEGIGAYEKCIEKMTKDRTLIIASNEPREYNFCSNKVLMSNYK